MRWTLIKNSPQSIVHSFINCVQTNESGTDKGFDGPWYYLRTSGVPMSGVFQ